MAEFISEYGLFLAKALTITVAVLLIMAAAVGNALKMRKAQDKGVLNVSHLNKEIESFRDKLQKETTEKHLYKALTKKTNKERKAALKAAKNDSQKEKRKHLYVIDFNGDVKASQVSDLRKSITAVLSIANPERDEVMLRLESPGGVVHGYGLAASQLQRIREHGLPLTICVDKVAASGGYMMACVGSQILASPFAYIGSVGVLLQLPNFHRLLKDKQIDYEMITAGEYKRTLTLFGENTDADRQKAHEDIQDAHGLFKDFIRSNRPSLDVDEIASGEVWFGTRALAKGLIDEIITSDEYITQACETADVYAVNYEHKARVGEKLGSLLESALDSAFLNWSRRSSESDRYLS